MKQVILIILVLMSVFFCYSADYIFVWGNSPTVSSGRVQGFTTTSDYFSGFSNTTNSITSSASANGAYYIKASISYSANSAGNYVAEIKQGSTTVASCTRRIETVDDQGNVSLGAMVNLSGAETFYLDLSGTGTPTINYVQFVICKLGEEQDPAFAEMYINSTQVTSVTANTFTTITGFTGGSNELWSLANNTLTPSVNAYGKYLAIFTCSYEITTGQDIDFDIGLSVNNNDPLATHIIGERKLNKNNDIGNSTACGIVNITSTADVVMASAKELLDNENLQVEKANVVLIRITDDYSTKLAEMAMTGTSSTSGTTRTKVGSMADNTSLEDGWSYGTDRLTCSTTEASGKYVVSYHLNSNMQSQNRSADLTASLSKNGSDISSSFLDRTLDRANLAEIDYGVGSGIAIVDIVQNDYIELYGLSSSSNIIDIGNANISLWRIDNVDQTLPVELSSFNAMVTSAQNVALNWTVHSETNGSGYRIYKSGLNNLETASMLDNFIPALNLSQTHTYSFVDSELSGSYLNIFYWIEFVELDNTSQIYGPAMVLFEHDNDNTPEVIIDEGIKGAYPNPFNPDVTISYHISSPKSADFEIYNLKGQLVKVLTTGTKNEGTHEISWNGKDSLGNSVASGTYFIKPVNLLNQATIKVMLTK